jgi:hypothetical protein
MSYRITLAWDLFPNDGTASDEETNESLRIALKCLLDRDIAYLKRHPKTPLVYDSGVVYQEEPPGAEDWADVPTCLKLLFADCEDLACWRAAELIVRFGIKAWPDFTCDLRSDGTRLYHIIVRLPDGVPLPAALGGGVTKDSTEDPSRMLGMR